MSSPPLGEGANQLVGEVRGEYSGAHWRGEELRGETSMRRQSFLWNIVTIKSLDLVHRNATMLKKGTMILILHCSQLDHQYKYNYYQKVRKLRRFFSHHIKELFLK